MEGGTSVVNGVWAAVPTPFDRNLRFDGSALRENVARLARVGVAGVYMTDADGEFYAIESEEFREIAVALGSAGRDAGIPVMAGVTWIHTAGVVDRLKASVDAGLTGAHVGHPLFMPMARDALETFWATLGRNVPPDFALVHYNSLRMPNQLTGTDYRDLSGACPQLVATKQAGDSAIGFMEIVASAPGMRHFTGEHALVPFALVGAAGYCSWLVTYNPTFAVAWWKDCERGDWDEALRKQRLVNTLIQLKISTFGPTAFHAIRNKAIAAASGFLVGDHTTRPPYLPVPDALLGEFQQRVREQVPELAWPRP